MRIDASTSRVTRAVPLTREDARLLAGSGGVWGIGCLRAPEPPAFTCRRLAAQRIDLRTGCPAVTVALPAIPASAPGSPEQLTSGLGIGRGAVWIVQPGRPLASQSQSSQRRSSVLRRLDLAARRLETVREISDPYADLAVDGHGAWVVDGLDRSVIRIDR